MLSIRNGLTGLLVAPLVLFGALHVAVASEVSGTLSSDGSTDTEQVTGTTLGATDNNEVSGQTVAQNSDGQIQGSVTGGREESAAVALANPSSWDSAVWAVPLAAVLIAGLAYFLWSRKVI